MPLATRAYSDVNISGTMIADVTPENPAPGEVVNIRVTSYGADLNRSNITWSNNGTAFKVGVGERVVNVRVGTAGTESAINITAVTREGEVLEKVISFRPAGVSLLWQARTYVPSYYAGRALPTAGSSATIVAEPDFIDAVGARIGAGNLIYEWTRNGNRIESASGHGKYYFEIDNISSFSDEKIGVVVSDISGDIIAENAVTIPLRQARLAVYEESPLKGTLFERAMTGVFDMLSTELTLRSEPYFYRLNLSEPPAINWSINGLVANPDTDNPLLLTLRQPVDKRGTAEIIHTINSGAGITQTLLAVPITLNFMGVQTRF